MLLWDSKGQALVSEEAENSVPLETVRSNCLAPEQGRSLTVEFGQQRPP